MTAHDRLQLRVAALESAVNAIATNGDALYEQFKALGNATAEALTQIETRLKAVESQPDEEQSA